MAGALKSQFKVVPGDKIIIYMPMTIESLIAIHACARIGATHVIVFGGFAAHELANRIDDKVMVIKGVDEGEEVIVRGLQQVRPGLTVNRQTLPVLAD